MTTRQFATPLVIRDGRTPPPLAELVSQRDAWLAMIMGTVDAIREGTARL